MNGDAWTSHQTVNSNIVATFHLGPASLTYPFFLIIYLYISTQFLFFLLSTGSSTRDPLFVSLLFLLSPPIIGSNSFRPEGRGRTVSIDDPTYPSWSVQWKKKKKKTKGTVGTRGIFRSRPNTQQRKKGNEKREAIELLPTRVRNDHRTRARVDFTSIVDSLRYTRLMPITNKEEEEGERATIFVIQPPPTRIFNELYAIADRRP